MYDIHNKYDIYEKNIKLGCLIDDSIHGNG